MMRKPGAHIPCYAPVAHGIHMVGGKTDRYKEVRIGLEPVFGRSSRFGVVRKNEDAGMAFAESDLVFGADHAMTFYPPDLCDLQRQWLALDGINGHSRQCDHDFLTCGHVRCPANDR